MTGSSRPLRRHILAAGIALLAATAPAQGKAAVHPGRVLDAAGKPVAAAKVVFASAPRLGASPDDEVVATAATDANGRFRVELVPTRGYSAWAVRDGDPRTASKVSAVTGRATELRLGATAMPRMGWLAEADALRKLGELTLQFVVAGTAKATVDVPVDADGDFVLPPLPDDDVTVRLFCSEQLVHVFQPMPTTAIAAIGEVVFVAPIDVTAPPGSTVVRLATTARAADAWSEPVQQFDGWPLAVTGANGHASVMFDHRTDALRLGLGNERLPLLAILATGSFSHRPDQIGERVTLSVPKPSLSGRVVHAPAGAGVRFGSTDPNNPISPWHTIGGDPFVVPLAWGKAGRRRYPDLAWLSPWLPRLPADDPFARVAVPQPVLLESEQLLGDAALDWDTLTPLRIQVLDASGAPAIGAVVHVVPKLYGDYPPMQFAAHLLTDDAGRCVAGTACDSCFVCVESRDAFAFAEATVGADAVPIELRLRPFADMTIHVTSDGKAVPGVHVELQELVQMRPPGLERVQEDAAIRLARSHATGNTAPDGRVVLKVVPNLKAAFRLEVAGDHGLHLVRPGETTLEVVLP